MITETVVCDSCAKSDVVDDAWFWLRLTHVAIITNPLCGEDTSDKHFCSMKCLTAWSQKSCPAVQERLPTHTADLEC